LRGDGNFVLFTAHKNENAKQKNPKKFAKSIRFSELAVSIVVSNPQIFITHSKKSEFSRLGLICLNNFAAVY